MCEAPRMAPGIETHRERPPVALVDSCVEVYREAFAASPYHERPERAEELRDRVVRYSAREGFRLPVALDRLSGETIGFGLGVLAFRGDWWRDAVAAAAGPQVEARWLGAACLE